MIKISDSLPDAARMETTAESSTSTSRGRACSRSAAPARWWASSAEAPALRLPSRQPGLVDGPLPFVLREVGEGTTTWEYAVDSAHFNPHGVLHGGVMM